MQSVQNLKKKQSSNSINQEKKKKSLTFPMAFSLRDLYNDCKTDICPLELQRKIYRSPEV